ncbi:TetR/AcrR family transcriptional regulator [Streptoalloteichus hindustanus]|uniref:Tetracyclin repressor, C-terminal all-alpha domain n=1 Tax=Streptoalloteichus hindustanus TaxID=2017 RepID=A0A1M5MWJ4_STRHI|nr:TetR/AcrR family transcriptional regulator [Streptoalloteichus hindustanus]SHG81696.1 Tetracyclin repressor, C-terminal all-alpha domain [Streptoalloteichus hindustanus]
MPPSPDRPRRAKTGGRTAQVSLDLIVDAGRRIGLPELSVQSVAAALGVSGAAVYRHVPSRLALERLVGEAILDELTLTDDPAEPVAAHLVRFATELRHFTLAHPGTAGYLQRMFPRGTSGTRLLTAEVAALGRRGYDPAAAVVLTSAVATIALGLADAEEARAALAASDPHAVEVEARAVSAAIDAVPLLRTAQAALPAVTSEEYFRVLLSAVVDGLVGRLPAGRPLDEVLGSSATQTEPPR